MGQDIAGGDLSTQHGRLRAAARRSGYETAADLAKAIGMSEATVRAAMNGTRPLTARTAPRFASFLRETAGWLLYGDGRGNNSVELSTDLQPRRFRDVTNLGATSDLAQHVRPATPMLTGARDVPIMGYGKGDDDGFFVDQGVRLGMAHRPAILENVPDAFAIEVWDHSMHPALKHGHLALIHPHRTPMPGDDVLVTLKDGQALVKELVRRTEKQLILKQYNPAGEIKIDGAKVDKVQLIVDSPRVRT